MLALFIPFFIIQSFFQVELNPIGKYTLEATVGNSKKMVKTLTIKKKSYELHTTAPFKGEYTEYGVWQLDGDTLILFCESRKDKYEKGNDRYNTNYRKQIYKYEKQDWLVLFKNKLCSIHTSDTDSKKCYEKD